MTGCAVLECPVESVAVASFWLKTIAGVLQGVPQVELCVDHGHLLRHPNNTLAEAGRVVRFGEPDAPCAVPGCPGTSDGVTWLLIRPDPLACVYPPETTYETGVVLCDDHALPPGGENRLLDTRVRW